MAAAVPRPAIAHVPLRLSRLLLVLALSLSLPLAAQEAGDTRRKLETLRKELKAVAAERRSIESNRGKATQALRAADEQVSRAGRELRDTERELAAVEEEIATLQARRGHLQQTLGGRREELARLLRAAYAQGEAAPLKLLLAQDRVADANRLLTYHGYLQRDRAQRIRELTAELAEMEALEETIQARQATLGEARARQREQLQALQGERREREALVADLDQQFKDRRSREQALGRDAKGLEQVLAKLRAAAARAEAERRAAAERAEREAREAREAARRAGQPAPAAPGPAPAATGPAVGGARWPVSGDLIAGFGANAPDGRDNQGLLIGAAAGATVKAAAAGTVVYSEWMSGYGLILIIDHGDGHMSLYAHNDALLRDVGDQVRQGDPVATVGTSGGHGRPALYFELRRDGQAVDPAAWLRR